MKNKKYVVILLSVVFVFLFSVVLTSVITATGEEKHKHHRQKYDNVFFVFHIHLPPILQLCADFMQI